ncbi:MAG: hypothetical protein RSD36_13100 [Terrisporobacter sp.]
MQKKRTLLMIAGLVWIMAGFMVFKLGFEVLFDKREFIIISLITAGVVFYVFYNFIFKQHK